MILFLADKPLPMWQGMLMVGAIIIGVILAIPLGAYIFVRVIAYVFVNRQKVWESSAAPLGLRVDQSDPGSGVYKPLIGERDGLAIKLTYYEIIRSMGTDGGCSTDPYAQIEVRLAKPLGFALKLGKRETFYEKAVAWFREGGEAIGDKQFDSKFEIATSDMPALNALLNAEIPGGVSPNLMTDLLVATENYQRVRLTDRTLELGLLTEPGKPDLIAPLIEHASYLASRVEHAANVRAAHLMEIPRH